jgi:predicted component of type VI protein secretion system
MMIKQYKKKPIVISAVQFTGDNFDEIKQFTNKQFRPVPVEALRETDQHFPYEAGVVAEIFDKLHDTWVGVKTSQWIIKGVAGEFYPCDATVFDATYDEVKK